MSLLGKMYNRIGDLALLILCLFISAYFVGAVYSLFGKPESHDLSRPEFLLLMFFTFMCWIVFYKTSHMVIKVVVKKIHAKDYNSTSQT